MKKMKKLVFLLLMSFVIFGCSKPAELTPDPVTEDPKVPVVVPLTFWFKVTPAYSHTICCTNTALDGTTLTFDGTIEITGADPGGVGDKSTKVDTEVDKGVYAKLEDIHYRISVKAGKCTIFVRDDKTGKEVSKDTIVTTTIEIDTPVETKLPDINVYIRYNQDATSYNTYTGLVQLDISAAYRPFSVTNGIDTQYFPADQNPDNLTGERVNFEKLHAGTYTFTIKDNKNRTWVQDITVSEPLLQPAIYTATTVSSGTNLSEKSNLFTGRNQFSVSFTYETPSSYVINKNYPTAPSAALLTVFTYKSGINLELSTAGIKYKRYNNDTPDRYTEVFYENSDIYKGKHKVVITFNDSEMSLYVDEALIKSVNSGVDVASYPSLYPDGLYIGTDGINQPWIGAPYMVYNGTISNMNIYNQALELADVKKGL